MVTHGACLKVGLVGLLGWPPAQAADLRGLDNCGWVSVVAEPAAAAGCGWRPTTSRSDPPAAASPTCDRHATAPDFASAPAVG